MARQRASWYLKVLGRSMAGVALLVPAAAYAQMPGSTLFALDSDHDGLSDGLEQTLLQQFQPKFRIGAHDCSVKPAEFKPGMRSPEAVRDNGTIYGQAFPLPDPKDQAMRVELHYYHLWRTDCGRHGHPLDTEHVAVLVRASDTHIASATWAALYWYAAAHEDTVCDVSQIARASTLHAETAGATVWISPDKHASYLHEALCARGCGADRCENMVPLTLGAPVNLGEPGFPMNGSAFVDSGAWPLRAKMAVSNFPQTELERVEQLPATDIVWFHPGRHPMQGVVARSSVTEEAIASSGDNTVVALSLAGDSTGTALGQAQTFTGDAVAAAGHSTGEALDKTYQHTKDAVSTSLRHVGKALRW